MSVRVRVEEVSSHPETGCCRRRGSAHPTWPPAPECASAEGCSPPPCPASAAAGMTRGSCETPADTNRRGGLSGTHAGPPFPSGTFGTEMCGGTERLRYPEQLVQPQRGWAEHKTEQEQPQEFVTVELQEGLVWGWREGESENKRKSNREGALAPIVHRAYSAVHMHLDSWCNICSFDSVVQHIGFEIKQRWFKVQCPL